MDWRLSTRIMLVASLVLTSGPTPVYAHPGVRPSIELAPAEESKPAEFLSFKVGPAEPETCAAEVVSENFEPLQGALDRTRQSVATAAAEGRDLIKGDLSVEGAKHLHAAIIEVQTRIGALEQLVEDRETKREIGKLSLADQLKLTLQTGERAEIYAQHFAAAEMLLIRRLIVSLADVAETANNTLELNEEMADLAKAAMRAKSMEKIGSLRKELKELQNRRGEFLTASRKASELELEFDNAINRLDQAHQAGKQFVEGLTQQQLSLAAIGTLAHSLNNLSQMANGARLFKQTIDTFDSNILEGRNNFDQNTNKTDIAIQARATELSLASQKQSLEKARNGGESKTGMRDDPVIRPLMGIAASLLAIAAIVGMLHFVVGHPNKPDRSIGANYRALTTPSVLDNVSSAASPSIASPPRRNEGAYDSYKPAACFSAGTPVLTVNGPVKIEEIKSGDTVMSFNHKSGKVEMARVVRTSKHNDRLYGVATFNDGKSLEVTKNHEFYSADRQAYLAISEIQPGENVQRLVDGRLSTVKLKSYVPQSDYRDVYNFEVEGNHNYFVEGILVHNKIVVP